MVHDLKRFYNMTESHALEGWHMKIKKKSALIIVDLQNDFCPGGTLPVPEGDQIVPVVNQYIHLFYRMGSSLFATRDWHPQNHLSFQDHGGIWPHHCVQNTKGTAFHPGLYLPDCLEVISKGDDPKREAYSGFQGTDLLERLRKKKLNTVFVGGLATDYCVKETVLDAIKEGFQVYLLGDAIKGVEVNSGDSKSAVLEMKTAGASMMNLADIERQ